MGSFSQGLLFVSCLSKCKQEIFITYSDRHLVGDGELWRSHNLQGMTVFTVPKILCKIVYYSLEFVHVRYFHSFCLFHAVLLNV